MKPNKEQIEVIRHFDNGGYIDEMALSNSCAKRRRLINKDFEPGYIFDWVNYDYEIYKEVKPPFPTKELTNNAEFVGNWKR